VDVSVGAGVVVTGLGLGLGLLTMALGLGDWVRIRSGARAVSIDLLVARSTQLESDKPPTGISVDKITIPNRNRRCNISD
jgi:hypothetical protein